MQRFQGITLRNSRSMSLTQKNVLSVCHVIHPLPVSEPLLPSHWRHIHWAAPLPELCSQGWRYSPNVRETCHHPHGACHFFEHLGVEHLYQFSQSVSDYQLRNSPTVEQLTFESHLEKDRCKWFFPVLTSSGLFFVKNLFHSYGSFEPDEILSDSVSPEGSEICSAVPPSGAFISSATATSGIEPMILHNPASPLH